VELHDERIGVRVHLAEDVSLANYLFHTVHVTVGQLLGLDDAIALLLGHHDLLLVDGLHRVQFASRLLANLNHLCEGPLAKDFDQVIINEALFSDAALSRLFIIFQVLEICKLNLEFESVALLGGVTDLLSPSGVFEQLLLGLVALIRVVVRV
jgi:hypothetical protein